MNYVNDRFFELMNQVEPNKSLIADMKQDVDAFMAGFKDSPDRLSRWGHYYFCNDDGGRLVFDLKSPTKHKCEVCNQEFQSEILDGVWVYFYRNKAAVTALVSAVIYRATREKKYFDYAVRILGFYAENYHRFVLHNKENVICDSYDTMSWGCGKMMPQGLNESIVAIRFVQTIEILRNELSPEFTDMVFHNMFREMFHLLAPQATRIHNISCWNLSAIGVMGFAFQDQEMIDFTFNSKYNIRKQLRTGVTQDYFWYEGSIHYNFFLLEGISYLFLFSKIYNYDFGEKESSIFNQMFIKAYHYAFDNQSLPNPNDGWPNLNLKTFSYIYHTVARAMGEDSEVGNLVKLIEAAEGERTILPLSEPYYCRNKVCLEQLLFNIDFDYNQFTPIKQVSQNFPKSNFAILRNDVWNAFIKYGLNGKSHAHPDIMNVELMYKNHRISRDLSNAGYRARLCNEWHRKTLSHNTVCCNGIDITSVNPGECLYYDDSKITAKARSVYEEIDFIRTIELKGQVFKDDFQVVCGQDGIYDYLFHFESDISFLNGLETKEACLGFQDNGYQHILDARQVVTENDFVILNASIESVCLEIRIDLTGNHQIFLLKTMDNPVNKTRTSILLRNTKASPRYRLDIKASTKPDKKPDNNKAEKENGL